MNAAVWRFFSSSQQRLSMSLFRSRPWWSAPIPVDEEYQSGCLCVDNVDNDPSGKVKVVTGSFQGILRIYLPRRGAFQSGDLLLEHDVGAPIMQVSAGRFIPSSTQLALAVLHPRKVTVYTVTSQPGALDSGLICKLEKKYEHALAHSSWNMTHGPFGGVYDKDFLCVQSFDGVLSFFEHDHFAFTRYLNNFLLPGPLCYIARTDSFVTANASMEIECYRYHNLALTGSDRALNEKEGDASRRKLPLEWKYNFGEQVLDICIARVSRNSAASQFDIVVLGEHNVVTLKDNGQIKLQTKLDFHPSCLFSYPIQETTDQIFHNLIIGSHSKTFKIYKETKVVWTSQTDTVPVAIRTAKFGNLQGLLVVLDDRGSLTVNYLGTDPSLQVVKVEADSAPFNYEETDNQLRLLQSQIAEATEGAPKDPPDVLVMRVAPDQGHAEATSLNVVLELAHKGQDTLNNIHVSVHVEEPLFAAEPTIIIPSLAPKVAAKIEFIFTTQNSSLPISNQIRFIACAVNSKNEPRTSTCDILAPFHLYVNPVAPPASSLPFQFTLDTIEAKTHQIGQLFSDVYLLNREAETQANIVSVKYQASEDVYAAVTGGPIDEEATEMGAAWLITMELARRLTDAERGDLQFSYSGELPLQEYFEIIDTHHACRVRCIELEKDLEKEAEQFRAIQKRLLVRFKDKNAAPLQNLDVLLRNTYESLVKVAESVEKTKTELVKSGKSLSAATSLIQFLIRTKYRLDQASVEVLETTLTSTVNDDVLSQGWEESVVAGIDSLIRTLNAQEAVLVPQMKMLDVTSKLQKQILLVCDKLSKGTSLVRTAKRKTTKNAKKKNSKV
ncbi:hypothetical protein PROFUN_11841 [Planoprotostelium fungivorum]|uniref:Uncharacterized protein n=1 Tax=Planoprotostelium fungivorum TaxID=1890364 RepID=A0A2P6N985_9EUKA|nr:hypothetical protein PROFUN_11841 [Planoprotostelium fungivorum]